MHMQVPLMRVCVVVGVLCSPLIDAGGLHVKVVTAQYTLISSGNIYIRLG
jgi:hypothetical protein